MKAEPFKIQAVITISIDAADAYVIEAHRRELNALLADLQARHGPVRMDIKSRRPRRAPRAAPPPQLGPGFEIVRARYAG
jgi:hypothetical protein